MIKCRFCREFQWLLEADKLSMEALNCFRTDDVSFRTIYKSAMISITRKRDKRNEKYYDKGRTTYSGYKLIYCPSCGVKLKK